MIGAEGPTPAHKVGERCGQAHVPFGLLAGLAGLQVQDVALGQQHLGAVGHPKALRKTFTSRRTTAYHTGVLNVTAS